MLQLMCTIEGIVELRKDIFYYIIDVNIKDTCVIRVRHKACNLRECET